MVLDGGWIAGACRSCGLEQFPRAAADLCRRHPCRRLVRLRLARGLTDRWAFVAALLLFLFLTSYYSLGQREQFAFLVSSPLLLLAARRAEGQKVAPWLAFAAGILAAPGLLLKPYFLLAPLMLEAWLAFRAKRVSLKPENVALGAAGLLYAITIPLFAPAYLSVMVPLVRAAYHGYNSTILGMVLGPHVMAPLLLLGGLLWASQERRSTVLTATVIAGSGFLLAGLWQHKGFTYHFIPALGCGFIGLGRSRLIFVQLVPQPACACWRR